jgi:hypothetical protein
VISRFCSAIYLKFDGNGMIFLNTTRFSQKKVFLVPQKEISGKHSYGVYPTECINSTKNHQKMARTPNQTEIFLKKSIFSTSKVSGCQILYGNYPMEFIRGVAQTTGSLLSSNNLNLRRRSFAQMGPIL